jgi:PadR family transcriptional regulator, regulatory protein PadR
MAKPDTQHYGYTLGYAAGVRSGVLYPLLTRLHDEGWVADGWEDPAIARAENRPPRRYYTLTPAGRAALTELLETR